VSVQGEEKKRNKVLVLGVGNLFCGDDGIGAILAERLSAKLKHIDRLEVINGGTAGLGLLYLLEEYADVIILDSVEAGRKPGEVLSFRGEELEPGMLGETLSSHQPGVTELLRLAKLSGKLPPKILILAVQVKEITSSYGLSEELKSKLPEIEKRIEEAILSYLDA